MTPAKSLTVAPSAGGAGCACAAAPPSVRRRTAPIARARVTRATRRRSARCARWRRRSAPGAPSGRPSCPCRDGADRTSTMSGAGTPMVRSILAASGCASAATGLAAFELRQVEEQRSKRRRRRGDEPHDFPRVALGFEEAFTQVNEVTLGLLLAAAPAIGVRDAHATKRILADDHDVARDEVAVLEREDVERALELVPGEQERHRQPSALPRRRERHGARRGRRTSPVRPGRASARSCLDRRAPPAHTRRASAAASRRSFAGRPTSASRSARWRSVRSPADGDAIGAIILTT